VKLYCIAGEASGDLHTANLVKAMRATDSSLEFRGWGGDLMQDAGVDVVKHYRDLAFMGFFEVIANLRTILRNMKNCKEDIARFKPDAVILVDYPGFNLRIATWCRENNIPVFYYISPQVWAWKENRVKRIRRDVDELFVILPFEAAFYQKHGIEAHFVGHPLLDVIKKDPEDVKASRERLNLKDDDRIVALLPGSRKQEISTMLPVMLDVAKRFPKRKFMIAGAPGQDRSFYESIPGTEACEIVFGSTYDLFRVAEAGLVTSGTATLEAALHGMPQAVCYKGNAISYHIAKRLVKINYISLVNLVMDREVVHELIQDEMNTETLYTELKQLLDAPDYREAQRASYRELREKLGGEGASQRAAEMMLNKLKQLHQQNS
jgi:lipid-A-disaccharide synthase